jgi:hypothetical protein
MILTLIETLVEAPSDINEAAEYILSHIEKAGMLPPVITILPYSYNRAEGTYGFEVNEWEPEND